MTEEKCEGRAEALLRRLHFHPAHLIAGIVLLITGISMAISFTMLVYYEEAAWRLRTPETFDAFENSRDCTIRIQYLMGPFAISENDKQHYYWGFNSDMYPAIIMIDVYKRQGISFIILSFTVRNEIYYLPFDEVAGFWKRMEEGGRKSFTYSEVDKSWQIQSHRDIFVHYLELIQKDLERRD